MKKLLIKCDVVETLTTTETGQIQGGANSVWKDCTARPTLTQTVKMPASVGGCPTWMTCPAKFQ